MYTLFWYIVHFLTLQTQLKLIELEDSILQLKAEWTGFKAANEVFKNEIRGIVKALSAKIDPQPEKNNNKEAQSETETGTESETESETESDGDGKPDNKPDATPVKETVVEKKMTFTLSEIVWKTKKTKKKTR